MRTDAFSLCSETVMGWSWCYGDWTRICLLMRMMLFTHEIFFFLLRYCDGLELVLRGLEPHLFAHAHDAFRRIKSFSLCSDTVMGWSFYYINFTCICLLFCA
jgi:hypothetical protein